MLMRRMHVNNKSATKFTNGILKGWKLSFSGASDFWKGSSANIVPASEQDYVMGVVYLLDESDIENLDRQEVGYNPIKVSIETDSTEGKKIIQCRTYVQKDPYQSTGDGVPSKLYKDIIITGARDHGIDSNYIDYIIKTFPDNGEVNCGPSGFVL